MQSEIQLQSSCYRWFHNTLPELRGCFFSVPNGSYRNKVDAMQLKASGLVPGEPDMVLIYDSKAYGFEFKTTSGQLSAAQAKVHAAWLKNGCDVFVVRSEDEFRAALQKIGLLK